MLQLAYAEAERHDADPDAIRDALLAEAEALADADVEINRRMGFNGAAIVPDGANLLHHCNTGALATVRLWHGAGRDLRRARAGQGDPTSGWRTRRDRACRARA